MTSMISLNRRERIVSRLASISVRPSTWRRDGWPRAAPTACAAPNPGLVGDGEAGPVGRTPNTRGAEGGASLILYAFPYRSRVSPSLARAALGGLRLLTVWV